MVKFPNTAFLRKVFFEGIREKNIGLDQRLVISCTNSHSLPETEVLTVTATVSNKTKWLNFRPAPHIHFREKKKFKNHKNIFWPIRKGSRSFNQQFVFRASPTLYKPPSIRLSGRRLMRATTDNCLSFTCFGLALKINT